MELPTTPPAASDPPLSRAEAGAMIRTVGHDLRNALTVFLGVAEGLEALADDNEDLPVVATLRAVVQRVEGIADRLRDVARRCLVDPAVEVCKVAAEVERAVPGVAAVSRAFRNEGKIPGARHHLQRLLLLLSAAGATEPAPSSDVRDPPPRGIRLALPQPLSPELEALLRESVRAIESTLSIGAGRTSIGIALGWAAPE